MISLILQLQTGLLVDVFSKGSPTPDTHQHRFVAQLLLVGTSARTALLALLGTEFLTTFATLQNACKPLLLIPEPTEHFSKFDIFSIFHNNTAKNTNILKRITTRNY